MEDAFCAGWKTQCCALQDQNGNTKLIFATARHNIRPFGPIHYDVSCDVRWTDRRDTAGIVPVTSPLRLAADALAGGIYEVRFSTYIKMTVVPSATITAHDSTKIVDIVRTKGILHCPQLLGPRHSSSNSARDSDLGKGWLSMTLL